MITNPDDLVFSDQFLRNGGGMTKREIFCMVILHAMVKRSTSISTIKLDQVTDFCDKFIIELNKNQK